MKKIGRPKIEKPLTPYVFQLNDDTNRNLNELVDRSYMSRVGIVRIAIDFLYYRIYGIDVPDELVSILKDLKKGNKPVNGIN